VKLARFRKPKTTCISLWKTGPIKIQPNCIYVKIYTKHVSKSGMVEETKRGGKEGKKCSE
jgi:hypothetical protein